MNRLDCWKQQFAAAVVGEEVADESNSFRLTQIDSHALLNVNTSAVRAARTTRTLLRCATFACYIHVTVLERQLQEKNKQFLRISSYSSVIYMNDIVLQNYVCRTVLRFVEPANQGLRLPYYQR